MKRVWAAFVMVGIMLVPAIVSAQSDAKPPVVEESVGLKVSPAIMEVVLKPGESVKKDFIVFNTTDNPVPLQIQPKSFDSFEEPIIFSQISRFNAESWIKISEPYHILEKKETLKLTATITAPRNATPCGHYAMLSVDAMEPLTTRKQSGVSVLPKIGIIVFVTVPGNCARVLTIDEGRFLPAIGMSELIRIRPKFVNSGTIHVMENSKVHISNIFGSRTIDIPPRIVLPNTKKEVPVVWEHAPIFGLYRIKVVGTFGPDMAEVKSQDQFILMFRWLPLLIIGVPLALIGFFGWKTRHRWPDAIDAFRKGSSNAAEGGEKKRRLPKVRLRKK